MQFRLRRQTQLELNDERIHMATIEDDLKTMNSMKGM